MPVEMRRATRNPFTVVVCSGCREAGGSTLLDALRAAVRRCSYGMLVTTECMFGAHPCGGSDVRALCRWLERGDWDADVGGRP